MKTFDTQALIELTIDWLEYLDIYKTEGCTAGDIDMALQTGWGEAPALRIAVDSLTTREWKKIRTEVIEAVNAKLFELV